MFVSVVTGVQEDPSIRCAARNTLAKHRAATSIRRLADERITLRGRGWNDSSTLSIDSNALHRNLLARICIDN